MCLQCIITLKLSCSQFSSFIRNNSRRWQIEELISEDLSTKDSVPVDDV